jgi:hypothetical protein
MIPVGFGIGGLETMRTLLLTLTTCLLVLPVQAKYSGGSGTAQDPYQIATAADLIALGEEPNDYDKHFILTADIDLDPNLPGRKVFDKAVIAPDADPANLYFQGTAFTGIFDGHGHTISHLTIIGKDYLGLFGQLPGEVKNLGVVDVNVAGSGDYVGGLVGCSGKMVGGTGASGGSVVRCYSTGAVSGNLSVGGLIGLNDWRGRSAVTQCYSTVSVHGGSFVGGMVGTNTADLTHCYSTGVVRGSGESVGGLVGRGSIRGREDSIINGIATACFWDAETSGQAESAAGRGLPTAQMKDLQTYLDAGWDWVGEIRNGTSEIWQMPPSGGYPVPAIFNGFAPRALKGGGTVENPYLITDALELGAIIHYSASAHYRLAASIDLSGICWGTAVIPRFAGTFDGSGHVIAHLKVKGAGNLGVVGQLDSGGEIKDLAVVDVNVVGSNDYVAGLVGYNYGTVIRCYSEGVVIADAYVGGLVGWNNSGNLGHSHSAGAVSGRYYVGGLVGCNSEPGYVTRCYSTAAVTGGAWSVGGLVGWNMYSNYVFGCFWDTQTSGMTLSMGGTGKTTAEMQTASTFLDAGWDFVGETANGTEDIWWINEGKDYPRLWWEAHN